MLYKKLDLFRLTFKSFDTFEIFIIIFNFLKGQISLIKINHLFWGSQRQSKFLFWCIFQRSFRIILTLKINFFRGFFIFFIFLFMGFDPCKNLNFFCGKRPLHSFSFDMHLVLLQPFNGSQEMVLKSLTMRHGWVEKVSTV